jgi:hypothetical protein
VYPGGDEARELIVIDARSSDEEIRRAVREAVFFEDRVKDALAVLAASTEGLVVRLGAVADFLLVTHAGTTAIEAKARLDRFNAQDLVRYAKRERGVQDVLFVSSSVPSAEAVEEAIRKIDGGTLRFLRINESDDTDKIVQKLRDAITVRRPRRSGTVGRI